jgi:hypothetical protein
MVTQGPLFFWAMTSLGASAVLMVVRMRFGRGAGLVGAYGLNLFILHWLSAAIYLLPWYWNLDDQVVLAGLQESTYAISGFAVGTTVITIWASAHSPLHTTPEREVADPLLVRTLAIVGLLAYFVGIPLTARLPTIGAVISAASGGAVVALAVACWDAAHDRHKSSRLWLWLAGTCLLPFITIAVQGFMGFGLSAAIVVFAFVASFYRPAWRTVAVALIGGYLGLSLYVTYMRDRTDIRYVVWGGESMSARLTRLADTFGNFELFDINSVEHLQRVDLRLNQNYLVGEAVLNLKSRPELFANGETLWDAMLAPVPRALWPDKPIVAGSGDLVSRFTGIRFAENTSVGIGQVMELYVNFGTLGVFLGFIVIGLVLSWFDYKASWARDTGDWPTFTIWFFPGLALLQLGGSLVDVTSAAASSIVVAIAVRWLVNHRRRFHPLAEPRVVQPRPVPVLQRR